jgi:hypothetical protein
MKVFLNSSMQSATITTKMKRLRFGKSVRRKLKRDFTEQRRKMLILRPTQRVRNQTPKLPHQPNLVPRVEKLRLSLMVKLSM